MIRFDRLLVPLFFGFVGRVVAVVLSTIAFSSGVLAQTGSFSDTENVRSANDLFIVDDDLRPGLGCDDDSVVPSPNVDRFTQRVDRDDPSKVTAHPLLGHQNHPRENTKIGEEPSLTGLVADLSQQLVWTTENQSSQKNAYHQSVPEPTFRNIRYGQHGRNLIDFWKAPSATPTPVVISIHGGGWNGGDKSQIDRFVDTAALLKAGISVAAINYRLIKHCRDLEPPVQGPMSDAARAVQFIRHMNEDWNIDKNRIAATGGSAGACTSLWLAYHDDLAQPASSDPVERESTRLMCVAASRVQSTLDPKQMKEWMPNSKYGGHAFGLDSFREFLTERDHLLTVINEYSPHALLDANDPETYLYFPIVPADPRAVKNPTHSAIFGVELQKRCRELNVPCELVYPGAPGVTHNTPTDFLIATLRSR